MSAVIRHAFVGSPISPTASEEEWAALEAAEAIWLDGERLSVGRIAARLGIPGRDAGAIVARLIRRGDWPEGVDCNF